MTTTTALTTTTMTATDDDGDRAVGGVLDVAAPRDREVITVVQRVLHRAIVIVPLEVRPVIDVVVRLCDIQRVVFFENIRLDRRRELLREIHAFHLCKVIQELEWILVQYGPAGGAFTRVSYLGYPWSIIILGLG